jgi:hypothetical protein
MIEKIKFKGKTYKLRDWVTLTAFGVQTLIVFALFFTCLYFL